MGWTKRNEIREQIVYFVNKEVNYFGVEVVDVRIIRVNLPDKARNAVYARMRSEREKEANLIRAEGDRQAKVIRAKANKEKIVIIAEANKKSSILKGEGDGHAIKICAQSYGKDKDFYDFYNSLEIYKSSFYKNSKLIISSNN